MDGPVAAWAAAAALVNGDEIRAIRFVRRASGYNVSDVDGLVRRVAAEIDAGRSAGPLIQNARFRKRVDLKGHYDIDAVDWFLEQLRRREDHFALGSDLWREDPVAQLTRSAVSDSAARPGIRRKHIAEECANAWGNFGQQPGTHLRWETTKSSSQPGRFDQELRTAGQQTIASAPFPATSRTTVSVTGRRFTVGEPEIPGRSTAQSWPPGIAELAACGWRDLTGHFAAGTMRNWAQRAEARRVREVVDEAGTPILYLSGNNVELRAYRRVTFPDQRWLRFLVRGTKRANAIMTAVDQAGNQVARYRDTGGRYPPGQSVEIAVHPDRELTDELILAIALSPRWLVGYFASSQ